MHPRVTRRRLSSHLLVGAEVRFTVNPLTGSVDVELIDDLL